MSNLPDQAQMELGYTPANLRYLRQAYNLTQKDVAAITATSIKQVSKWETCVKKPSHADMPLVKWLVLKNHVGAE